MIIDIMKMFLTEQNGFAGLTVFTEEFDTSTEVTALIFVNEKLVFFAHQMGICY